MSTLLPDKFWERFSSLQKIFSLLFLLSVLFVLVGGFIQIVAWGGKLPDFFGGSLLSQEAQFKMILMGWWTLVISISLMFVSLILLFFLSFRQDKRKDVQHEEISSRVGVAVSAFLQWHRESRPNYLNVLERWLNTEHGRKTLNNDFGLFLDVAKELNGHGFRIPYTCYTEQRFHEQLAKHIKTPGKQYQYAGTVPSEGDQNV